MIECIHVAKYNNQFFPNEKMKDESDSHPKCTSTTPPQDHPLPNPVLSVSSAGKAGSPNSPMMKMPKRLYKAVKLPTEMFGEGGREPEV